MLRGVSMEVPADGFVGIIGPNGSGKTTLLRLLAGTLRPFQGSVTLDGTDVSRVPRTVLARRMAVVPQETHLAFDYTVLELVLMGRYPHLGAFEVEGPEDLAIARDALAATGTLEFQDRAFETLSGGEKQRVVIAAALAQITRRGGQVAAPAAQGPPAITPGWPVPSVSGAGRPGLLLLDEPTAALDLGYQLETASLLRDLRRQPVAIVISTHDLNFAARLCRTLVLLKQGQVIASGNTADVLTPDLIAALYGVAVDVKRHERAGHLVVVPIGRTAPGSAP